MLKITIEIVENKNKEIEESLESVPVEIINCYSFEEAKEDKNDDLPDEEDFSEVPQVKKFEDLFKTN